MTMNLEEFRKYMAATRIQREKELSRLADIDVNGNDEYYESLGREIESHPIGGLGTRGLIGCSIVNLYADNDQEILEAFGNEIESHPIVRPGTRGLVRGFIRI